MATFLAAVFIPRIVAWFKGEEAEAAASSGGCDGEGEDPEDVARKKEEEIKKNTKQKYKRLNGMIIFEPVLSNLLCMHFRHHVTGRAPWSIHR